MTSYCAAMAERVYLEYRLDENVIFVLDLRRPRCEYPRGAACRAPVARDR